MALPLVLVGLVIVALAFVAFQQLSVSSRHKVSWVEDRARAKYIAESALTMAAAAIFQNDFEARWYKQSSTPNGKYNGFSGSYTGSYAGGSFRVVAEDIYKAKPVKMRDTEGSPDAVTFLTAAEVEIKARQDHEVAAKLTYDRIDMFAEGTYGNYTVVAYQALALMPEEPVFKYVDAQSMGGDMTNFVYEWR